MCCGVRAKSESDECATNKTFKVLRKVAGREESEQHSILVHPCKNHEQQNIQWSTQTNWKNVQQRFRAFVHASSKDYHPQSRQARGLWGGVLLYLCGTRSALS